MIFESVIFGRRKVGALKLNWGLPKAKAKNTWKWKQNNTLQNIGKNGLKIGQKCSKMDQILLEESPKFKNTKMKKMMDFITALSHIKN